MQSTRQATCKDQPTNQTSSESGDWTGIEPK